MYAMSGHIYTKDMLISETTKLSKEINRTLGEKFNRLSENAAYSFF